MNGDLHGTGDGELGEGGIVDSEIGRGEGNDADDGACKIVGRRQGVDCEVEDPAIDEEEGARIIDQSRRRSRRRRISKTDGRR